MSNDQPLVSIDVIPVRLRRGAGLEFATGARIFEPFLGEQALPGVLLRAGESIEEGALRALESKVGLPSAQLTHVGAFDSTNRDPRGATISIALLAIYDEETESKKAHWTPLESGAYASLPFDHGNIVAAGEKRLEEMLWSDREVTRQLFGEEFSTSDVLLVKSPTPRESNVMRWLTNWGPLEKLERTAKRTGAGRPSSLWRWVEDGIS